MLAALHLFVWVALTVGCFGNLLLVVFVLVCFDCFVLFTGGCLCYAVDCFICLLLFACGYTCYVVIYVRCLRLLF